MLHSFQIISEACSWTCSTCKIGIMERMCLLPVCHLQNITPATKKKCINCPCCHLFSFSKSPNALLNAMQTPQRDATATSMCEQLLQNPRIKTYTLSFVFFYCLTRSLVPLFLNKTLVELFDERGIGSFFLQHWKELIFQRIIRKRLSKLCL
jgi:hypothetical protein